MPRYSAPPPPAVPPPRQPGRILRAVALTAVSIGVLVLGAAAFVLSYPGLHAVARQAGISAPLARGYPVILDAMLVIACAAVLSLRGAGAVSKVYAWLSLVVLLGATAGADALHSTGTVVPHKTAAFAAAVLPWVLLLIGFGLLLAMMRHFRLHRPAPAAVAATAGPPAPAEEPRRAALPAGPTPAAGPAQLAAGATLPPAPVPGPPVPGPPVPAPPVPAPSVPAPSVPAPPQAAAPRPDIPEPRPAPEPAAAKAAAAPVPPSPGPPAADPPLSVPPQPSRDQRQTSGREAADAPRPAGRPVPPPAPPAEPDLAYLDRDDDLDLDDFDRADGEDRAEDALSYSRPGDQDAEIPEEIFAAPPVEDDLTAEEPADRPLGLQPAFHRMWSSPTPPGDDED